MTKFAKTLMALAAMASLTAMTPMMADAMPMKTMKPVAVSFRHDRVDPAASARIDARVTSIKADIRTGERMHRINVREAGRLTAQADAIAATKRMDTRNGLSFSEAATLNARLDSLSAQVRMASRR